LPQTTINKAINDLRKRLNMRVLDFLRILCELCHHHDRQQCGHEGTCATIRWLPSVRPSVCRFSISI